MTPRPVLDVVLDLVLQAPRMIDRGHTRESIRAWLYERMDGVCGGPVPAGTTLHGAGCRCNMCDWDRPARNNAEHCGI